MPSDRELFLFRSALLRRSLLAGFLTTLFRALLRRHFRAFLPSLREADCYRLFLARDFLARATALQSAALPLVHRLFDFLTGLLTVPRHSLSPPLKSLYGKIQSQINTDFKSDLKT